LIKAYEKRHNYTTKKLKYMANGFNHVENTVFISNVVNKICELVNIKLKKPLNTKKIKIDND
jgi:hypothetical protein